MKDSSHTLLVPGKVGQFLRSFRPGVTIVFTNGCFDLIHPGHLDVIRHCRSLAGAQGLVVVGLNSDESIRRIKGPSRPIMNQVTRGELVGSIRDVDHVEVFNEDTPYELIKDIVPHFVVKGGDYLAPDVVGSDISHVEIVPLRGSWSTSRLIDRIKNG